jgi:hypothetical protein
MADLGQTFDANSVEPAQEYTAIPAGKYRAVILKSEWKPTKKGGQYLEFVIEILDRKYKGRRVWERLNLKNESQVAVDIANATLSSICRATGVMRANDSSQLHGIPFIVGLKVKEYNGKTNNEPSSYESVETASAAAVAAPQANSPAPWEQPVPTPAQQPTFAPAQQPIPSPAQQPVPPHQPALPAAGCPQGVVPTTAPVPAPEAPQSQPTPVQQEFGSPVPGQQPVTHQPASVQEDEIPF